MTQEKRFVKVNINIESLKKTIHGLRVKIGLRKTRLSLCEKKGWEDQAANISKEIDDMYSRIKRLELIIDNHSKIK